MHRVEVSAWRRNLRSISFIKLVQNSGVGKRGLKQAKDLVGSMLAGAPFTLDFETQDEATLFVRTADELGAIAVAADSHP